MATVSELITSARYDLRDEDSTQWSDTLLVDLVNRAVGVLDIVLGKHKSDFVLSSTSLTTTTSAASVSLPSDFSTERWVEIDEDPLQKADALWLLTEQAEDNDTGEPYYYALQGDNMIFERIPDQAYTVDLYYNSKTSTLSSGSNMPYSDEFNQVVRQAVVMMAKAQHEYTIVSDDALMNFFNSAALRKVLSRNSEYKPKLDF